MKSLIQQNNIYYSTILLFILSMGILLLCCPKGDATLWINRHYSISFDYCFLAANLMGTAGFSIIAVLILTFTKGWKTGLQAAICFISTLLIVQFLKYIIFPGEPRPTVYFEGKEILRLIEGVKQLKTESFPSGHTSAAFSVFSFLALVLPGKKWHWLFALLAASTGYARMYLSQHFTTDVYTGMIIGVAVTTLLYYIFQKMSFFKDSGENRPLHKRHTEI